MIGLLSGALIWHLARRERFHQLEKENLSLRAQADTSDQVAAAQRAALEQAELRLAATLEQMARTSLAENSETFLKLARESLGAHHERAQSDLSRKELAISQLLQPIKDALDKTHRQIGEIEKNRHAAFGGITEQLRHMVAGQEALQGETRNLVSALRRPEVRGQWGELTLRRVVELAGMVGHCDFVEQAHTDTDDGAVRPDMIVQLPERGTIVVDAKTPLDAYLTAIEATTDQDKKLALQRHARKVAERVRELSSKAYWKQFEHSPQFVVLFIPGDQFLSAALDENPALMEDALRQQIIIATPSNLIALLKTVAYQWRQDQLTENAEKIRRLAQDLHDRIGAFTAHLARVGKQLEGSVKAYNSAVGSLERKVLPGARKFVELGVQEKGHIDALAEIDSAPREAVDLTAEAAGTRAALDAERPDSPAESAREEPVAR